MSKTSETNGSDLDTSNESNQSNNSKSSKGSGFRSNTEDYINEYVKQPTDIESDLSEKELEKSDNEENNEQDNSEYTLPKKTAKPIIKNHRNSVSTENGYAILNNATAFKNANENVNIIPNTRKNTQNKSQFNINKLKLPPIIITKNENVNYDKLIKILQEIDAKYATIQSKKNTYIVNTTDINELRLIKNAISNLQYFTYTTKDDRRNVFIIKQKEKDIEIEEIMDLLKDINPQVNWFNEKINNWIVVKTPPEITLNNLKSTYIRIGYSKIIWEIFKNKKGISQCHRCQKWGHSTINCNLKPNCMKCGEQHLTKGCKNKEAKCVNCEGAHFANSIECPTYIKKLELKEKNMKKFAEINNNRRTFAPAPRINPWGDNRSTTNEPVTAIPPQSESDFNKIRFLACEIGKLINLDEIKKELETVKQKIENEPDDRERKRIFKQYIFGL